MLRYLILLLFTTALADPAFSNETAESKFTQANTLYRKGDYTSAVSVYEHILNKGLKSGELYYNLGNCYYKSGETAKAILAYERARKFLPEDEDLAYNLRLAYGNTVDKIEPVPQLFYERWWTQFLSRLGPSAWAVCAVVLLWLATALAAWYLYAGTIRARKLTFMGSGTFLMVAILCFVFAGCSYKQLHKNDAAIVIEASTIIRSSPDDKSTTLFMLHAGTRIEVVDELGAWKQIRIANGNSGWVKKEAIELI